LLTRLVELESNLLKEKKKYIIPPKEIMTNVLRINVFIDPYLFTTIISKVSFEIEIIHSMIFSLAVWYS